MKTQAKVGWISNRQVTFLRVIFTLAAVLMGTGAQAAECRWMGELPPPYDGWHSAPQEAAQEYCNYFTGPGGYQSCSVGDVYSWGAIGDEWRSTADVWIFYVNGSGFSGSRHFPPVDMDYTRYPCEGPPDVPKNLGEQCPAKGHPTSPNPVTISTGNKFQAETDYVGQGAFPLRLVRYYNSQMWQGAASPPSGTTRHFSRLGPNWYSSYDQSIAFFAGNGGYAYAYRPDGQTLRFKLNSTTGQFTPDADIADRLVRFTNGSGATTGWQYTVANTEAVEAYDSLGKLTSITSRSGLTQALAYDGSGRLSTIADAYGRTLTLAYDGSSRVASFTDPDGKTYSYTYNSANNIDSVTFPDGKVRTYIFNESANTGGNNFPYALTGIVDETTTRFATFKYNAQERASSAEHAGGVEKYLFAYSDAYAHATGRTTVTDPLLQQRDYDFATVKGMANNTSLSQPCPTCGGSSSAAMTYDANGNVASRTDFNGNITNYVYDLARNLETSRTEAYGTAKARTITTTWHSTYRLPTQIDEPGRRTTYTYDTNGNALTRTILDTATSESRTWTYTYNSVGQVLTANGPRTDVSDVTTYTYYTCTTGYQCGQLQTVTNALSQVTTYNTYNAHGQPLTITDPNGVVTTLTYDLRQRLTSRTVGMEQTTFEYWPTGLLKKVTLPDSSYLLYTYDAAHRLTDVSDTLGNNIHYTLDAMGNRTKEEAFDPASTLSRTRSRVFDSLNRLSKEIGAANTAAVTTTFGYDNNGNQTSVAAPLSRNSSQTYDALNRLSTSTDPASGVTSYGYDALDQLISVTDPRTLATTYTYNSLGDLKQQVSPDTGTTTNTYDSGGNLKTRTDARSKVGTYTYDALNRVTQLSYPDQTMGYTYDSGTNGVGRLTGVSDGSGSSSWTYDTHGRVTAHQQTIGSVSKSVGYSYNSAGQLQTLTLPSGNTIGYGYSNGRVVSLTLNSSTVLLSNVLYSPFGPTMGWTWGNSTLAVREYDTDGKVTDIDSAGLKTYSYDNAFRVTGIADAANSSLSQTFGYDLLDRLTSGTGTSLNQSWTYDANGNRLTQGGSSSSTYTIATTNNRITGISGALTRAYSYDAAGNTTGDGTVTYTYDDSGRMVSAIKAGTTATYKLNALGQRVRKTISGTSTYFVYDEAGHLLGEYDNSGTLIQEMVWMGDIPVGTLRPNGGGGINHFYIHSDHLNTPRRISRPSDNAIVWRWDSDPFGTTAANQNPSGLGVFGFNLRFPGQYFDAETGLNYNYFRDYDTATGSYVESDPVGLKAGINTYTYVQGNPLTFFDSDGLGKEGGQTNIGGNDPAMPRHVTPNSPQSVKDEAIREAEKVLKQPGLKPQRARKIRGWIKVISRNAPKAVCPPLLDQLALATARELCMAGDQSMCEVFLMLGGEIDVPRT